MKTQNGWLIAVLAIMACMTYACTKEAYTDGATKNIHVAESGDQLLGQNFPVDCWGPNPDPYRPCPAIIYPVCACGVITFNNQCEAERLGFKNTEPGSCLRNRCRLDSVPTAIQEQLRCPKVYQPVCGCDGVTYDNSCYALRNGVLIWGIGECS